MASSPRPRARRCATSSVPRASRDITVPIGTPTIPAISLVGQIVDLAQHDHLAKHVRQRIDDAPGSICVVVLPQHRASPASPTGSLQAAAHPAPHPPVREAPLRVGNSCRRCAGWRTATAGSGRRETYRSASAPADSTPARRPRHRRHCAADSAPAYRPRRDAAARRRENAAPVPDRARHRPWSRTARFAPCPHGGAPPASLRSAASRRPFDHDGSRHVRMQGAKVAVLAGCRECERVGLVGVHHLRLEQADPWTPPCAECRRGWSRSPWCRP